MQQISLIDQPDRLADLINQKFEENEQRYLENKKISNYNKKVL